MFDSLPQFVPQEVCLSCDGCCRFDIDTSRWRARAGMGEFHDLSEKCGKIIKGDEHGFLPVEPFQHAERSCRCTFFDPSTNGCSAYDVRPFECRLYPFIIRRKGEKVMAGFHWACPHMQDSFGSIDYVTAVERLKVFFDGKDIKRFLSINRHLISEYDGLDGEIEDLFEVFLDRDPGADVLDQSTLMRGLLNAKEKPLAVNDMSSVHPWRQTYDIAVEHINDVPCIFFMDETGCFMPSPPLTVDPDADTVGKCFAFMNERNINPEISRIENVTEILGGNLPADQYKFTLKGYEYCYDRTDIAGLKGNLYRSKRSDYNHFCQHHDAVYRGYQDSDLSQCLELYDRWAEGRIKRNSDDMYVSMIRENREVHQNILRNFRQLNLIGRVVEINGKIAAYTFGYPAGRSVFSILLEIADTDIKGLPVYIFSSFCSDGIISEYDAVNVMDDSGLENLRRVKLSYHPKHKIPSYTLYQRL